MDPSRSLGCQWRLRRISNGDRASNPLQHGSRAMATIHKLEYNPALLGLVHLDALLRLCCQETVALGPHEHLLLL